MKFPPKIDNETVTFMIKKATSDFVKSKMRSHQDLIRNFSTITLAVALSMRARCFSVVDSIQFECTCPEDRKEEDPRCKGCVKKEGRDQILKILMKGTGEDAKPKIKVARVIDGIVITEPDKP